MSALFHGSLSFMGCFVNKNKLNKGYRVPIYHLNVVIFQSDPKDPIIYPVFEFICIPGKRSDRPQHKVCAIFSKNVCGAPALQPFWHTGFTTKQYNPHKKRYYHGKSILFSLLKCNNILYVLCLTCDREGVSTVAGLQEKITVAGKAGIPQIWYKL